MKDLNKLIQGMTTLNQNADSKEKTLEQPVTQDRSIRNYKIGIENGQTNRKDNWRGNVWQSEIGKAHSD